MSTYYTNPRCAHKHQSFDAALRCAEKHGHPKTSVYGVRADGTTLDASLFL